MKESLREKFADIGAVQRQQNHAATLQHESNPGRHTQVIQLAQNSVHFFGDHVVPAPHLLRREIGGDADKEKKDFLLSRLTDYAAMDANIAAMFSADQPRVVVLIDLNVTGGDPHTRCVFNERWKRTVIQITLNIAVQEGADTPGTLDSILLHELALHAVPAYLSFSNALDEGKKTGFKMNSKEEVEALEAADHGNRLSWSNMACLALLSEARGPHLTLFREVLKEIGNYYDDLGLSEVQQERIYHTYANLDDSRNYSWQEKLQLCLAFHRNLGLPLTV